MVDKEDDNKSEPIKETRLTLVDLVKGLCFFSGLALLSVFFLVGVVGEFLDTMLESRSPLIVIIGAAVFFSVYGLMVAFSRIKAAGYDKNIFSELCNILKGRK